MVPVVTPIFGFTSNSASPKLPTLNLFADNGFTDLFERHALGLLRYARSRIYDRDDAEDLCSEAWLRFYESYRESGSVKTTPEKVVFGILKHLLYDYYKRKKQIKTALIILEDKEAAPSVESEFIWREFEEHVIACLFGMADSLKLAWLLKFDPGRVDWIAVLSGSPPDEIRSLLRKSLSREIFIDEPQAAALMRRSVWSYRRKYEKAQKIMNEMMRKNNWGDLLDKY